MATLPPEELVRWCQRTLPDDTAGFEALVAQYKQGVYATACRLLGNRHDAEDVAQEVFLKVYRRIRTLNEPAALTTWIYKITTRACFDALARRGSASARGESPSADDEGALSYPDAGATPEEAALRREVGRCLERALSRLDADARAMIVLRDVEDLPYKEVAEVLALGLSAVKMRIHRTRLALQRLLAQVCPGVWRAGLAPGGQAGRQPRDS